MTKVDISQYPYPRRQRLRRILRQMARMAFAILSDFYIIGRENIPETGPLLVVANHFHFADPVAVIRSTPWPIEFVGGTQMPNAPLTVTMIPKWWGYYPVHRGGASLASVLLFLLVGFFLLLWVNEAKGRGAARAGAAL